MPWDDSDLIHDTNESARTAGLHYSSDEQPGIRRRRRGRGFSYLAPDGEIIRDLTVRGRIEKLVIPPAWEEVWICPSPRGHLQATGRDARQRKQYRYHPLWTELRSELKYAHLLHFAHSLPDLRRRVDRDLARHGFPRERVLALVVRLLERSLIRIGNEEYLRENRSFGLTTLRRRHVSVSSTRLYFAFRGKSGKEREVTVADRRLARLVRGMMEIPGQELFHYLDEEDRPHTVDSGDVNAYLAQISGENFTAKDFRTWRGTVLCASSLLAMGAAQSDQEARRNITRAVKETAHVLGNRPAVCRQYYIHPAVLQGYRDGSLFRAGSEEEGPRELAPEERIVLHFLEIRSAADQAARKSS